MYWVVNGSRSLMLFLNEHYYNYVQVFRLGCILFATHME